MSRPTNLDARILGALKLAPMSVPDLCHALGVSAPHVRKRVQILGASNFIHPDQSNEGRTTIWAFGPHPVEPKNPSLAFARDYKIKRDVTPRGTVRVSFGDAYRPGRGLTMHHQERGFSSLEMI